MNTGRKYRVIALMQTVIVFINKMGILLFSCTVMWRDQNLSRLVRIGISNLIHLKALVPFTIHRLTKIQECVKVGGVRCHSSTFYPSSLYSFGPSVLIPFVSRC